MKIEVAVKSDCTLGEGPVWDSKRQLICWVDILKGQIHQFSPEKESHRVLSVNQMVGAIALCPDEKFLAALKNGFGFVDRETGDVQMVANPEAHLPNNRFNDGKCDPAGRFWAGTLSLSEDKGAGNLYMVDSKFNIERKIQGVTISNGLSWSHDHKTLYYIDTPTYSVVAYNYDQSTGKIDGRRIVIQVDKSDGYPDGMTIDSEGMLWVAHWDGWQIIRWNPLTGKALMKIALPVARGTSCAFGGKTLEDLYITTAKKELTEEQLKKQPMAGSLLVIKNCGYKGMPAFEFRIN